VPPSPFNHINPSQNSSPLINVGGLQSPYSNASNTQLPPDRPKPNYYSSANSNAYLRKAESYPNEAPYTTTGKKSAQVENAIQWRQYLIYYHFYCVEMLAHYSYIQGITNKP
jgi:hypothetical protein